MAIKRVRDEERLGYLRYSGAGITTGIMDARKAAHALLGFDSALRYFLAQEAPALRDVEFEIPIRVRPGSWLAEIPTSAGQWLSGALGAGAILYTSTAAKTMAENDFKDVSLRTIFRKSIQGLQSVVELAKHLGTLQVRRFKGVKWGKDRTQVGIPNEGGKYLFVNKSALDLFVSCPTGLFTDIAAVIQKDRELQIGLDSDGEVKEIRIRASEKHIFYIPDDENEPMLPELKHGQSVELEGIVSRGNNNSNTLGFQYQGHTLVCVPRTGSIVRFKAALFLKGRIRGIINRSDDLGGINNPRPRIIFDSLRAQEHDEGTPKLFPEM